MMKIELVFLEMAKRDLEAAKCLFERRLYPQAIFHLQQSVEKAVKSRGIREGIIKKDELKKFGHDPTKIYVKMIEYWKHLGLAIKTSKIREILPEFKVFDIVRELPDRMGELEEYSRVFKNLSKDYKKSVLIQENKLEKFLSVIARSRERIENVRKRVDIECEYAREKEKLYRVVEVFDRISPGLSEQFKVELRKELEEKPQEMKNALKSEINFNLNLNFCDISLFSLSLILLPHAIYSRYPEDDLNPLEIYTKELPLIKKFNQIAFIIAEVLRKMTYPYP